MSVEPPGNTNHTGGKDKGKNFNFVYIYSNTMRYFLIVYSVAVVAVVSDIHLVRYATVVFLPGAYVHYVRRTLAEPGKLGGDLKELHIARIFHLEIRHRHIALQVLIGLGLIVFGAHEFVLLVERLSGSIGVSALVLSLIITPIATELPEKMNSVIWTRMGKDTLALGNITGAMVFQSCIPVALGVALVNRWHLHDEAIASVILAIASTAPTYAVLKIRRKFSPWALLSGGLFYAAFIVYIFAIPH